MTFRGGHRDYDSADAVELRLSLVRPGVHERPSKLFVAEEARLAAERLFVSAALDFLSTYVAGMITAEISLVFADGGTVAFDVYNDRLAVNRFSKTGHYLTPLFTEMKQSFS
jgi:hypothetical protein